jgi:hypothetical protein
MPPRKQPMRLEVLALRKCIDIYRPRFENWMNSLYSAHQSGEEACSLAERRFSVECREMEDEILTLAPALLRVLSPRLASEYDKFFSRPQWRTPSNMEKDLLGMIHLPACKVIFRSVLNRFIQKFDTDTTSKRFGQFVIVENLDSVPHLVEFAIAVYWTFDRSELLASMIHYLTNLRTFKCRYCTDEIIRQLRLHCPT